MSDDPKVLEQAAAARTTHVNLLQMGSLKEGIFTTTSVTFAGDDGRIEHYECESTTYKESTQAHRVAHALRDLAFKIDLMNGGSE